MPLREKGNGDRNGDGDGPGGAGRLSPYDIIWIREELFEVSRREFAARSGVSETSLGRYERGEMAAPPWFGMVVSALVFGLPPFSNDYRDAAADMIATHKLDPSTRLAFMGAACIAGAWAQDDGAPSVPGVAKALSRYAAAMRGDGA